jgi:nitroreductase
MDVFKAIETRRSIRHYKADTVSAKDLNAVLEAARLAPSWANTQCWRFVVVTDIETKARLAATLAENNRGSLAIKEAPVLIVACAEMGKSGYMHGEFGSDKGDWFMFDVALAMQNLSLAACALGLGTLHVGWFDAKKASHILNVPDGVVVVEMTPLGYPEGEARATTRKDPAEIIFFESYGRKKGIITP